MWGAHEPCNREEWEISLLQVFNADQSDRAQDLLERNVPMEKLGTSKGHPFKGQNHAEKGILRRETERFSPSLFVILVLNIVAVSFGCDVSLDCTNGFNYGMFLFVIFAFMVAIIDGHGWPMGILSGLLMLTVLKLIYRLYVRHELYRPCESGGGDSGSNQSTTGRVLFVPVIFTLKNDYFLPLPCFIISGEP
jgi:hypothetical protein